MWGPASGPISPVFTVAFDVSASVQFVYATIGLGAVWFGGAPSFTNDTTGGEMSSGPATGGGGYFEAGLTKGLFFSNTPTSSFEVRPGIGYGYLALSAPSSSISNCRDASRSPPSSGEHA